MITISELQSEYLDLEIETNGATLEISDRVAGLTLKTIISDNSVDFDELMLKNSITIYSESGYTSPRHAEFLISADFFQKADTESTEIEFEIDNVRCRIAKPSHIFEFIMSDLTSDKYWDPFCLLTLTISSEQDIDPDCDIINALFWAYIAAGPNVQNEDHETQSFTFPCISIFYGYYGCLIEEPNDLYADFIFRFSTELSLNKFSKSKYFEPLSFYSTGKFSNDVNTSFLQYYKVLEYFFIFEKRSAIEEIIDKYKENNDFPVMLKKMKSILGYKEESLLTEILNTFSCSVIRDITKTAHDEGLIESSTVADLSKQLYKHRNSIAHGKETFEDDLITLSGLVENISVNLPWCNICERCALYILATRCFGKL